MTDPILNERVQEILRELQDNPDAAIAAMGEPSEAPISNSINETMEFLDEAVDSIRQEFHLSGSSVEDGQPSEESVTTGAPEIMVPQESQEEEDHEIPFMEEEDIPSENTIIPKNSESLLVSETTSRFSSAEWFNLIKQQEVTLAGLGGIGSWTALLLSRLDISNLIMYDNDIVDASNLSGQLYCMEDLNTDKTAAIASTIGKYSAFYKYITMSRFTEISEATNIMICGFDNMKSRKIFFEKWKWAVGITDKEDRHKMLFIDGRLAAEELQVLCIRGDDDYNIKRYSEKFLFSEIEADYTPCSYKQTSFCANMIASIIVNLFVNHIANLRNPLIPRDLPFYTMYNAETMYFKTES